MLSPLVAFRLLGGTTYCTPENILQRLDVRPAGVLCVLFVVQYRTQSALRQKRGFSSNAAAAVSGDLLARGDAPPGHSYTYTKSTHIVDRVGIQDCD
jgi:hypothetical protein